MKKILISVGLFAAAFLMVGTANAQMMRGYAYPDPSATASTSTLTDTQLHGQTIYQELQNKQTNCSSLSNSDFESLGEYYMGAAAGSSFQYMDNAMDQMMGQNNSDAMYTAIGERVSGCNTSAVASTTAWNPMMQGGWSAPWNNYGYMPMMGYYGNGSYGYGPYGMMDYGYGGSWVGWLFMLLFWAIVIIGIIVLIRWLMHGARYGWHDHGHGHSALDILKERYAKGEIDKREYEEKRKDLG